MNEFVHIQENVHAESEGRLRYRRRDFILETFFSKYDFEMTEMMKPCQTQN